MVVTGKVTFKRYQCTRCEHISQHSTNHYGQFYDRCPKCSWKNPLQPAVAHECLEDLPDGYEKPIPWQQTTIKVTK